MASRAIRNSSSPLYHRPHHFISLLLPPFPPSLPPSLTPSLPPSLILFLSSTDSHFVLFEEGRVPSFPHSLTPSLPSFFTPSLPPSLSHSLPPSLILLLSSTDSHFVLFKEGGELPETVSQALEVGRRDRVVELTVLIVVGSLLGSCQTGVHWVTQAGCG